MRFLRRLLEIGTNAPLVTYRTAAAAVTRRFDDIFGGHRAAPRADDSELEAMFPYVLYDENDHR